MIQHNKLNLTYQQLRPFQHSTDYGNNKNTDGNKFGSITTVCAALNLKDNINKINFIIVQIKLEKKP